MGWATFTVIAIVVVLAAVEVIEIVAIAVISFRAPSTGLERLVGRIGEVRRGGLVFVDDTLWKANSDRPLEVGDRVKIISVDGFTLNVKKNKR